MHWLIDGHNLIGRMPTLRLDDPNDEEKLVTYLSRFRARTGHKVTVTFDPGYTYHPAKTQQHRGVTVKFAPYGQTADQIIIQRLRRVKNPQALMVVTSDEAVRRAAKAAGVRVVAAPEFVKQLLQLSAPSAAHAESQADIKLSADEVQAWLDIFNQSEE